MIGKEDKVLLIYHKDDNDGVYSAALIYRYLDEKLHVPVENIDTMGADYNLLDSIKRKVKEWKEQYTSVIMTDISFNDWRVMSKLQKTFDGKFIWIDHHAPAIRMSVEHGYGSACGIRETWTSAIGLAYEWLWDPLRVNKSSTNMPQILQYLAGWDSWNPSVYGIADSDECMAVNLAANMDTHLDLSRAIQEVRDMMYDDGSESDRGRSNFYELQESGQTILEYQKAQWATLVKENAEYGWTVNGRSAVAMFLQGPTTSKMFESISDDVKNAIVFKHAPNGKWNFSVYNLEKEYDKEINLGMYLKTIPEKVGRTVGGHSGAAGGTISQSKFLKLLKTKAL